MRKNYLSTWPATAFPSHRHRSSALSSTSRSLSQIIPLRLETNDGKKLSPFESRSREKRKGQAIRIFILFSVSSQKSWLHIFIASESNRGATCEFYFGSNLSSFVLLSRQTRFKYSSRSITILNWTSIWFWAARLLIFGSQLRRVLRSVWILRSSDLQASIIMLDISFYCWVLSGFLFSHTRVASSSCCNSYFQPCCFAHQMQCWWNRDFWWSFRWS